MESKKSIKSRLQKLEGLPPVPKVVKKLNELIQREDVPLQKIAEFIEKDQALTLKLLRLANSPLYGFYKKITTVKDAIFLLGIETVRLLVITSFMMSLCQEVDNLLWEHCVGVFICVKSLAEQVAIKEPFVHALATAGLLHDIGLGIIMLHFKDCYQKIKSLIKKGINPCEAEREVLGMSHTELGALLLKDWGFPEILVEVIKGHHSPEKVKKFKKEAFLLHLADFLVHARGYPEPLFSGLPPFEKKALEYFKKLDLKKILAEFEKRFDEFRFFLLELEEKPSLTLS